MRAPGERADSAAFRRRLPRQPAKLGEGKLAAEPSTEETQAVGEARGCFVVHSRQARRKSEPATLLMRLVEAAAAPPDGPYASHRLWVTDTLSEGGEGTSRGRGLREGTGVGPQGRRCRGAEASLGNCSSFAEEEKGYIVEDTSVHWELCLEWGERGSAPTVTMVTDTLKTENVFSAAAN